MEAAAPLPKKRKSGVPGSSEREEISSLEPPPPEAVEAADPPFQQPPPGAEGGEEGVDRISGLPDDVLGDIIPLLSTREGARTQTLASRWRHLWRSAPLNLDYGELPVVGDVLIALISQILSSHAGPGRRLRISARYLCNEPATVDAWLQSAALSNLQELEFRCAAKHPRVLPAAASIPDDISGTLHFPQLKQLSLEEVSISESTLHRVISGWPVLESMLLNRSFGFNCARISSPTLRTIGVRVCQGGPYIRKIIVEDAPCLERLLQLDMFVKLDISIISAPNLEIMGCLSYRYCCSSGFQVASFLS
jgi:hypothetical protein